MVNHVIIMAGGAGKRLWPASNSKKPKQLMELVNGRTLLLATVERALSLKSDGEIIIVTHFSQIQGCIDECLKLSSEERKKIVILGEPVARNTAPALALAAQWIKLNKSESDSVLVLAADHLIEPIHVFKEDMEIASLEADNGFLVTFGITPSFPSTGYGYIEVSVNQSSVRKVLSFKEKPNEDRAKEFLIKGNYFWNAGMFAYRIDRFFEELQILSPHVKTPFDSLTNDDIPLLETKGLRYGETCTILDQAYGNAPSISIDYALMEKSKSISMVTTHFEWNDIGSWDEIAQEQMTQPSEVFGDIGENFIYSDLPVAIKGVNDLIVVVKNGSVMICPKGQSQLVKDLVEEVKEKGRTELL